MDMTNITTEKRRLVKDEVIQIPFQFILHSTNQVCCSKVKETISSRPSISRTSRKPVSLSIRSCFLLFNAGSIQEAQSTVNVACDRIPGTHSLEADTYVIAEGATKLWGLDRSDQVSSSLNGEYDPQYTGFGATVYVIDTGINDLHQDFNGRASLGISFVASEKTAEDYNGHGTHCAGTIGGSTYGMAKNARVIGVKVLDGAGGGSNSNVIKGIQWAVNHMDINNNWGVISMSLGGGRSASLDTAVKEASDAGAIVVVAAGNDNKDACLYSPAAAGLNSDVVTVGAIQKGDQRSEFSNFGKCVDVFAPGTGILSTSIGSFEATQTLSGTSMATPHVAGAMALLLEKHQGRKADALSEFFKLATPNKVLDPGTESPNLLMRTEYITFAQPSYPTLPPTKAPGLCIYGGKCFSFASSKFGAPFPRSEAVLGQAAIANTLLCDPSDQDFTGKVVLVARGTCSFTTKVENAQANGALFVVIHIVNSDSIFAPGADPIFDDQLSIASAMISLADANSIKGSANTIIIVGPNIQDVNTSPPATRYPTKKPTTSRPTSPTLAPTIVHTFAPTHASVVDITHSPSKSPTVSVEGDLAITSAPTNTETKTAPGSNSIDSSSSTISKSIIIIGAAAGTATIAALLAAVVIVKLKKHKRESNRGPQDSVASFTSFQV